MKQVRKVKIKSEKGQSLIELGVSLVVLLILLAGVVDLGRLAFYYIALRDAAQEGASYGSIFPNDCEEIENRVRDGVVGDSSKVDVGILVYDKDNNSSFECGQVCPKKNTDGSLPQNCLHAVVPEDIIEITVVDDHFKIAVPFFSAFVTNNDMEITIRTVIRDNIIRVPK